MDGMNEHPQFEDTGQVDPTIRDEDLFEPEDTGQKFRPGNMVRSEHPPKPDAPEPPSEHPDCRDCKLRVDKGNRTKDLAISVACFAFGLLAITAVVVCVIFTVRALLTPKQPVDPNVYAQQIGLDPNNVQVYYDTTGKMHLNVYVQQMPDVDINVTIDRDGKATVSTVEKGTEQTTPTPTESQTPTVTPEPTETVKPTEEATPTPTVQPTEEVTPTPTEAPVEPTETITPTPTEKPDDQGGTDVDKPVDNPPADIDEQKDEMSEEDYLKAQQERIENGEGRYSSDDTKYMIVWGDTLTKISHRTGYSINFLAKYNNIQNPDLIIAGEPLYYPTR